MAFKIVKNGDETEIQAAVAWIESLGISRNVIRGITVDAQVGQPLTVTATLMVPEPEDYSVPRPVVHGDEAVNEAARLEREYDEVDPRDKGRY